MDEWYSEPEDEELLNDLFSLLDDIYNDMAKLPKDRPIFSDKQVLSFEDLTVGTVYTHYHNGTADSKMELVTEPYQSDEGSDSWFIKVRSVRYDFVYEQSLADCSVIPYFNGGWNTTNYLTIEEDNNE